MRCAACTYIHFIVPSSFIGEADALHDAFEAGEYIKGGLQEMGAIETSALLSCVDNKGLVETAQQRAKGGSKLQRRKIGIILTKIKQGKFKVKHLPDKNMPVDFMTKLVAKKKLKASINFLYNLGNAVARGGSDATAAVA